MRPAGPCLIPELRERPTSVFLHGTNRPLLNWVLYALLHRADPEYIWTDVRFENETLDRLDPLARGVVPETQLSVVRPTTLGPSVHPHTTASSFFHPEEDPEAARRLVRFLGLPQHTQEMISRVQPRNPLPILGLSNAHRLASFYSAAAVQPTIRAILEGGVSLVMTWADAVPGGSATFDYVVSVEGASPLEWRRAELRLTLGLSRGPLRPGRVLRLGDLPEIVEEIAPFSVSER